MDVRCIFSQLCDAWAYGRRSSSSVLFTQGWLFASELSYMVHPLLQSNLRTDKFSIDQSIELIHTIVSCIRREVPKEFILSIKLSAADYRGTNSSTSTFISEGESRTLEHILAMAQWGGVDIIEISGGDYEKPGNLNANKLMQLVVKMFLPFRFYGFRNYSLKIPSTSIFRSFFSSSTSSSRITPSNSYLATDTPYPSNRRPSNTWTSPNGSKLKACPSPGDRKRFCTLSKPAVYTQREK